MAPFEVTDAVRDRATFDALSEPDDPVNVTPPGDRGTTGSEDRIGMTSGDVGGNAAIGLSDFRGLPRFLF